MINAFLNTNPPIPVIQGSSVGVTGYRLADQQISSYNYQQDNKTSALVPTEPSSRSPRGSMEEIAYYKGASNSRRVARASMKLPIWLLSRVWELNLYRSSVGWDVSLRIYNVVPWDHPLFEACRNADLPLVQQLLVSGQGSLYDVDEWGRGPLHVRHRLWTVR